MKLDVFAQEITKRFTAFVTSALAPVRAKLGELETKLASVPAGKDGAPGKDGQSIKGDRGEPGLDAFALAASAGFKGTEAEWLASLRGKDGAPGLNGKDGAAGKDGQNGAPGARGEKGDAGERGADGVAGKDGAAGVNGKDGAPGKDAAELDITKLNLASAETVVAVKEIVDDMAEEIINGLKTHIDIVPEETLLELTNSLKGLDETLRLPIKPVKDANGDVIGAQRG